MPAPTEMSAKTSSCLWASYALSHHGVHLNITPLLPVRSLHIAALCAFFPELQKHMFTQPIQGKKSENANPLRNMFLFQNRCSEG